MKTKSEKKFPTVPVVILVAIVLVVGATLAQFISTVEIDRLFQLSNFTAEGVVSFDGVADMSLYTDSRGYLVDVKNTNADNYIGNLRVDVKYAGYGVGLIRVRVVEEWSTEDTQTNVRTIMPFDINMTYLIGANNANLYSTGDSGNLKKWYDNRSNDYRFYYATPVYCSSTNTVKTIPLITGFNDSDFDPEIPSGTEVHLIVETEVVQVNRYPQYWGMTTLPWLNAVSATQEDL